MTVDILQLCPLTPFLEAELAKRFAVHRLFEMEDKAGFLAANGDSIRAAVTGGHLGIPADLVAVLPKLEIVAINGVGFDKVDLAEAKRRGIRVSNTPDVLTADVADLALGLILAFGRQLPRADAYVRAGKWLLADMGLSTRVAGRRYGIFGLGRIGMAIARRLEGFDARISYSARSKRDVPYDYHETLAALAANCDVLILAAAATAETRHVVNAEVLDALGPNGTLINVARGSLVDERALVDALQDRRIGGAALDVFEDEPRVPEELFGMDNVLLAPHLGSATHETRRAMADLVLANLDAHFAGTRLPTAVV
ncbi:2-hydroxyacid dehydrogenase [Agrobacterium rhizogenes]|uniref:D-2-hydroxyacid dehydrogensase protein n=1 Tax=Rhizobium rhizogenes (strain K84 / ATCC BAA-868) TaxID=311403 RepID=B9JMY8_RHIR8|nr:2-hydroxyacid dehydrogenase [Rhizobium rhizogenes]ACM28919.1 D-2-hydroxyacid dehydrogensase protein [Rhizobium rhizogenes K84]KAA6486213.1 2-hydroxyacid dehydrogenase [Agrobacterium sp. ICMP 7243]OCJ20663.1 dihydrofolate reductase [Agrobacterium sp. B133/95]KEA03557.1 dihydrofolate reductase [Rhizobium rhizogenes]MDJ1634145.1 2-hydroxyacid dehydrogenase [Rhizobium rhizogenes]